MSRKFLGTLMTIAILVGMFSFAFAGGLNDNLPEKNETEVDEVNEAVPVNPEINMAEVEVVNEGVDIVSKWNLENRNMYFTASSQTTYSIDQNKIVAAATEALGAEGKDAKVSALQFGYLTDLSTPEINGILMSERPVWLVSFEGINIPSLNLDYIFTEALVIVDAETGQWLMMIQ